MNFHTNCRMATESPIRITETSRTWTSLKGTSAHGSSPANIAIDELGLLLKSEMIQVNGRALVPSRSGSAPPSIEDSSNIKMNPRLTPPPIPKDNRCLFPQIGTAGYSRRVTSSDEFGHGSLSISPSKLPTHREGPEDDRSSQLTHAKLPDMSISFSSQIEAISSQHEGVSEMTQKDMSHSESPVYKQGPSLIPESLEEVVTRDAESLMPMPSADDMQQLSYPDPAASISSSGSASMRSTLSQASHHKRQSITVDSHLGDHISNSIIIDTGTASIDSSMSSTSSSNLNSNQLHSHQHNMVQEQVSHEQRYRFEVQNSLQGISHSYIGSNQFFHGPSSYSETEVHPVAQSSGFGPPLYATSDNMNSSTLLYQNLHPSSYFSPQYTLGGYTLLPEGVPPYIAGYASQAVVPVSFDAAARQNYSPQISYFSGITSQGFNLQQLNSYYGQFGFQTQPCLTDPLRMQHFQRPFSDAYGLHGQFEHLTPRSGATENPLTAIDLQKGSGLSALSADQKFQNQGIMGQSSFNPGKAGIPYYVGSPRDAILLQFPTTAVANPVLPGSPVGGTNFFCGKNELRFSPRLARNSGMSPGWLGPRGPDGMKSLSFLEELKSGKGRKLELSNIIGHVVEFSGDQHGSRFIQQTLEKCSLEEKESVFKEVLPNTSKLMTDVFGNYVVQKFFDYGSLEQRKQLANQLAGQMLPYSLQMYGCRVIQKALDVIEPEQKIKLVHELDGHVLTCVHDQNGNHVIQKCIETIPIHQIEFIISSFHGQVAQLSTHPYGCRVIQRVLEHCTDDLQSQFIVNEILECVCALAQDQYGNYVTQHVLERGKARERRLIISRLSGHIVQLSQHKFASNVVEKCLDYGDSTSLEKVIAEIIGKGDGNDNLLTMVKDQYANYVIQKIIRTCSSNQREMLLCRIRAHLSSLKRYTYGKHIAARFEQLYGEELRNQDPDAFTE